MSAVSRLTRWLVFLGGRSLTGIIHTLLAQKTCPCALPVYQVFCDFSILRTVSYTHAHIIIQSNYTSWAKTHSISESVTFFFLSKCHRWNYLKYCITICRTWFSTSVQIPDGPCLYNSYSTRRLSVWNYDNNYLH